MLPLLDDANIILNVRSAKSGQDAEALSKKQCPRCGSSELVAVMVDIPQYVRDAFDGEKRRRGL
jgi:hypothetical protein